MTTDSPDTNSFELQPADVLVHDRQLWQARFSPCGTYLLGAGYDGRVHRWVISEDRFEAVAPFDQHNGWVQSVAFSPDDGHVYSADSWGRLSCWSYTEETPEPIWTQPAALAGWIRCLAVSPDGKWVAVAGSDPVVRIWSTAAGSLHQELPNHSDDVLSVCYHPREQALVTGDWKGIVRHWDLESGEVVRELDGSPLYRLHRLQDCGGARVLAFDAEGKMLACGGQKDSAGGFATGTPAVLLFNWESGDLQQEMEVGTKNEGFVYDAQFHPDAFLMTVSCGMPKQGHLWCWRPGEAEAWYIKNDLANGRSLSLHPHTGLLAVATSESRNANGRRIEDNEYLGGTAKIHLLKFAPRDA